jgi:hypothetical protein
VRTTLTSSPSPHTQIKYPPQPQHLLIVDDILTLPPRDTPKFQHWLGHKDTYGTISSIITLGLTLTIIHDHDSTVNHEWKCAQNVCAAAAEFCGAVWILVGSSNSSVLFHTRLIVQDPDPSLS